jgi:hypothetical protein
VTTPNDLDRLIDQLAQLTGTTPAEMRAQLTSMAPAELAALIDKLPASARTGIAHLSEVKPLLGPGQWLPSPGPQTEAYNSLADCLLYGGEPGGGKSQLGLGLAFTRHKRTFVMRRQYADLSGLISNALKIHGGKDGFNASPPPRLRIDDERVIHFRAAHLVGDEQSTMGVARDLLFLDEACQFAESQVRFLQGWVRSEDPNQRCRTILATNPPLSSEGAWVAKMFEPWLSDRYPHPAKPGELRWVISDDEGKDLWVSGPDDVRVINGKVVKPTSRTYIPSSLSDNPYLARTGYQATLDALPEPFRSLLMGGFKTQFRDQNNQVIPTAWVRAAMARWKSDGWRDFEMTCMALDAAAGGGDAGVLCWRHGGWYAPFVSIKAAGSGGDANASAERALRRASEMAAAVIIHRKANAPVVVDMGGGFGQDVANRLRENGTAFQAYNGSNASTFIGKGGIRFVNRRAEAWWALRTALDPETEGGSVIALPDDAELLADLTAPTFEMKASGIQLESKEAIKARLGRSPDKGDAAVMCLAPGNAAVRRQISGSRPPPRAIGSQEARRKGLGAFYGRYR